jgi:hypothetical protein
MVLWLLFPNNPLRLCMESVQEERSGFMERKLFVSMAILISILFLTGYQMMSQTNQLGSQITNSISLVKSNSSLHSEVGISPNSQADAKGSITKLESKQFFVEEYPEKKDSGSKGLISLDSKTQYYQQINGILILSKKEDLKLGLKVSVWCRGYYLEMYPLQCTADKVLLETENHRGK